MTTPSSNGFARLVSSATPAYSFPMPVVASKKPAKRRAASKTTPARKATWLGYARDLMRIRSDIDLAKPTLPAGKHLA